MDLLDVCFLSWYGPGASPPFAAGIIVDMEAVVRADSGGLDDVEGVFSTVGVGVGVGSSSFSSS